MVFDIIKYNKIRKFLDNYYHKSDEKVSFIAVTKNQPVSAINAAIEAGILNFAENRVQEAEIKYKDNINKDKLKLHLIGHLQTNKVKKAIDIFDFFHTLDRDNLANEFSKYLENNLSKKFLIQVNTGMENQKSGIMPNIASEFIQYCIQDKKLNVIGLMCLPPQEDDPQKHFLMLKKIASKNNLKQLSMGMTSDYKIAVECGSTFIRIGTGIFGQRV